jgi:CRP-like cAMP-binding protein
MALYDPACTQLTSVTTVSMSPHDASWMASDAMVRKTERNRILRALSERQHAQLAPALAFVSVQAHQVLATCDEPIRYIYFPRDAVLSMLVPMEDGRAVEGATIGNEGLVGLQAFLGDDAGAADIVVQIPGEAARMRVCDFRDVLAGSCEIQALLQRYTLALMNQLARTAGCNRLHNVVERAARCLLMCRDRAGRDTFPLTHEYLALLLGVRRASVSTAAEALQNAGVIGYQRGSISVLDVRRLEALACEDYLLSRTAYDRMYAHEPVT